ncbi:MAG: MurR/RpiR family transcriptional regulator [Rhodobacteraceae bacterium]|nr:MurR/RpiR family transcriptional regulator [Paracoccaceae bacterium]
MSQAEPRRPPSPLHRRLEALGDGLTRSEATIAQWLTLHEGRIGLETGASIAARTGVSEITVSRFLRRLGYRGLAALKADLHAAGTAQLPEAEMYVRLLDGEIGTLIRRDAEAMLALSAQVARPEWDRAMAAIHEAGEVFVTGFQTVRGVAEDFARRLAIVRDRVRFLSPHDSGLAEWIGAAAGGCLIVVDTVPYAAESEPIVRTAAARGMTVVVTTDDLNTWAAAHTDFVFRVTTKVGTFVESTGPLASLLNLVTHTVAARDPGASRARLAAWPDLLRCLGLFA